MIAQNAGQDGGIVTEKVIEGKGNFGYNALTDVYEDLVKAGVIDPTKGGSNRSGQRRQRGHAAADQRRVGRREAEGRQGEGRPWRRPGHVLSRLSRSTI